MTHVSRETQERLEEFADLVRQWNPRINLVARSTLADLWARHVEDSLQVSLIPAEDVSAWCDIGSGGGFPGVVVAIARPEISVTLIESDLRKATFLRHACRTLSLNARVLSDRIENVEPQAAPVVSARALAPLTDLLGLASRHGMATTRYLFPKGVRHEEEIRIARKDWSFHIDLIPSAIEKGSVILDLQRVQRVSAR
ncbi:16S rRNA (guanine(527)-N(7))-methyltransferase RsmG [Palleronia caenipelagi]|uniref:Ribosomal RNA small subunit methyltransferase G n=1 Tax=Palleronia caenipelagi TaxID=2489174 RepID=A0A547Q8T2_9RHOB|nr:16S rRNA (guanine(527)-N(7))-methyltransferase RsmG [Palleronia caenipelagi]TRD22782.1 16S rRNA (guanine(527)-N(7))-methyltransferase RsmG [Palleronia caenipelagi]